MKTQTIDSEFRIEFELEECLNCKHEKEGLEETTAYPSECGIRNRFWAFSIGDKNFPKEITLIPLDKGTMTRYHCSKFTKR